jgi:DNA processing protein
MERPEFSRELTAGDMIALGYDRNAADRIVGLLQDERALKRYLSAGHKRDCFPVTRVSHGYPPQVRQRLGLDAPGCLWAKGDLALLNGPLVSLVGSRELSVPNRTFAESPGRAVAQQGITLVSGNAKGADRVAQDACLAAGGKVICVVADELQKYPVKENILFLSEDCFDLPFSAQRALSRNRVIHTLGFITLVAQCGLGVGGTWDGTNKNLQRSWSPVFCFDDGTHGMEELVQLGATFVGMDQLTDLSALHSDIEKFL